MTEDRVAKLERELAELRAQLNPPPPKPMPGPHDYSAGLSMPDSVAREMASTGVDPRQLVQDFRRGPPGPQSIAAKPAGRDRPSVGSNGWIPERPIGPPAGVAICDQLVDAQDAVDRRQRERERG